MFNQPIQVYIILAIFLAVSAVMPLFLGVIVVLFFLYMHDSKTKSTHHDEVDYSFKKDYLKTPTWKAIRLRILERDNYTCQQCGESNVPLEVHHITYSNLYKEKDEDLVSLCRHCHESIHRKYGYNYDSTFPLIKR